LPRDEQAGADLVTIKKPKYYLEEVILSEENKSLLMSLLLEYKNQNILRDYFLSPKRKLLFCGPPGCGKTMTAHALAQEMGLPLLYVRMDSLISSYLGDTATNLREIFKYAEKGRWVIFFDEFDAIGKSRDDEHEHGELKRAVNTLLQILDNVKIPALFIAATNHQHLLDRAAWRRFEEIVFFDKPNRKQIQTLVKNKLKVFDHDFQKDVKPYLKELDGFSHAQIENICQDAIKLSILGGAKKVTSDVIKTSIALEKRRQSVYREKT